MKKLMIAAAAAALVGGAYAADEPQVYDMTITLKSTECNNRGATYAMIKDCTDAIIYRTQVTTKIYGKFWGCDCDVIAGDLDSTTYAQDVPNQDGFIFWTKNDVYHDAELKWTDEGCVPLQIVGPKAKNVEGAFKLTLYTHSDKSHPAGYTSNLTYTLAGAGYGTVSYTVDREVCSVSDQVIKSMTGYVVGTRNIVLDSDASGCYYCGGSVDCGVWLFCDNGACGTIDDTTEMAAAFGSFTLKYNSSQSRSVARGRSISEIAFTKNAAVRNELDYVDTNTATDTKTTAQKLEEAYKTALAAYQAATNNVADLAKGATECSKYVSLTNDAAQAAKAWADATNEVAKARAAVTNGTGVANYLDAIATLVATNASKTASQKDKEDAQKAVDDTAKALAGDIADTVKSQAATYKAKLEAASDAEKAQKDADKAVTDWTSTDYDKAKTAADTEKTTAQTKLQTAQIACQVAGGTCN